MTKQKFSEVLLSRFRSLDREGKYFFVSSLMTAGEEYELDEGSEEFKEWAATIAEMLFPELMGDIVYIEPNQINQPLDPPPCDIDTDPVDWTSFWPFDDEETRGMKR